MRIEGYMILEWRGQHRFAIEAFERVKKDAGYVEKIIGFSGLLQSDRKFDYLWDASMRGRPTLHELSDREDDRARLINIGWKDAIYERLNKNILTVLKSFHAPLQYKVGGGYVQFARVT